MLIADSLDSSNCSRNMIFYVCWPKNNCLKTFGCVLEAVTAEPCFCIVCTLVSVHVCVAIYCDEYR